MNRGSHKEGLGLRSSYGYSSFPIYVEEVADVVHVRSAARKTERENPFSTGHVH